ncbi:hypothetical protein [Escherichia coli]|nr:hypothetical protein [Escherichia coli]
MRREKRGGKEGGRRGEEGEGREEDKRERGNGMERGNVKGGEVAK